MLINFNRGQPSLNILPTELFLKSTQQLFSEVNAAEDVLQYGPELGHPEFLDNLAKFLTKEYQMPVSSKQLCVTPGASLSLQHILSILTRPDAQTKYVYLQDPTYFLVFDIFLDLGYRRDQFVSIPEEGEDGMDIDVLEDHLRCHCRVQNGGRERDSMVFDSVLYCVPSHANPTGSILSSEKRKRLVDLGRKYNMLIVCDDVYDALTYEGPVPKRLVAYDLEEPKEKHVVISNGSFSKLLSPGARVGWIEADSAIIKQLGDSGSFKSGGSPAYLSSQIINTMMKQDVLHHHVAYIREVLSDRLHNGLWHPIQKHLVPLGCRVTIKPKGGYFVWLTLPFSTDKLIDIIQTHKIELQVGAGTLFNVKKNVDCDVRLCFAHYDTSTLQEGVDRLKKAILIGLT
ncbi:hypothetical protein G6F70_004711 [Rhizopus microsporus]|nr:hypothetical protein G6F71_004743 [Rhizopus microsporus]KAG1199692.1 hypothetical protein G6F70_004711 [Rhizopus microsporus]KAG1211434.1 hypothetical protein G6F69_004608 [Rhizopus microsporus]